MSKKGIPQNIKQQLDQRVAQFNQNIIQAPEIFYSTRYRGRFVYLDRSEYGHILKICRLSYTGNIEELKFAIYKYSREQYDPDDWAFPGFQHVDETIEGAMRAGLKAYPPQTKKNMGIIDIVRNILK